MLGWDACTLEPWLLLRWIECHPAAAAWVQAFGAILAVLIAVGLPLYFWLSERHTKARETYDRTCSVVASLVGAIWLLDIELNRVERKVRAQRDAPPPPDRWGAWFAGATLDAPPELLAAVPAMHGLQEGLIGPFRTTAMLASTYNGYIRKFSQLEMAGVAERWAELFAQIDAQLTLLRAATERAKDVTTSARVRPDPK